MSYYSEHREELSAKQKARYDADPARYNASAKAWRDAHKGHIRESNAKWRAAHADHIREYQSAYAKKHAERIAPLAKLRTRAYSLRTLYGLTAEQFRDMLVGQAGRCLICFRVPPTTLVVDHDHATGAIRGLLCNSCNRLLGIAGDSPRRLDAAARYLRVA